MVTQQILCAKMLASFLHSNQMLFHHVSYNCVKYVNHMFQNEQVGSILSHSCLPQEGQEMAGLCLGHQKKPGETCFCWYLISMH